MEIAKQQSQNRAAQPLTFKLKESTKAYHRRAEHSKLFQSIRSRSITATTYIQYLRNLYPVYVALEQRISDWSHQGQDSPLASPALARAPAIAADLHSLYGADWRSDLSQSQAGIEYQSRVTQAELPELIAHAYVRYLGDLNGGQMMRQLLLKHSWITAQSLNFYCFEPIQDLKQFKTLIRQAIEHALPVYAANRAIAEAQIAFELNIRLANE